MMTRAVTISDSVNVRFTTEFRNGLSRPPVDPIRALSAYTSLSSVFQVAHAIYIALTSPTLSHTEE